MTKSGLAALGAAMLVLSGCGPDLTGNFSGTHTQTGAYPQSYTANLSLVQDGESVSGQLFSQPQQPTGSTGTSGSGSYPYYPGTYSYMPVNGTLSGTIDGDILRDVRLTVSENGCTHTYQGSFNITDGSRLQGTLIQLQTSSSTKDGSSTSSYCSDGMYPQSVGAASFDVHK